MSRKKIVNTFDIAMKKRLAKFIALSHHAMQLEQWLGKVVGDNADWPVHLHVDNDDDAQKLRNLLQAVADAGKSVKADGECMRQLMRWQAETFGSPYDANGELRPGCNCQRWRDGKAHPCGQPARWKNPRYPDGFFCDEHKATVSLFIDGWKEIP